MSEKLFQIAQWESDCYGGGYAENLALSDSLFNGFDVSIVPAVDIDCHVKNMGHYAYFDVEYQPVLPYEAKNFEGIEMPKITIKQKLERDIEKTALPHGKRNAVIRYLAINGNSVTVAVTWDEDITLFSIDESHWQELYEACLWRGIMDMYELKTYQGKIPYTRIILDWKGDCE